MRKAFHYTPIENLERIVISENGLEPRSPLVHIKSEWKDCSELIVPLDKYLFAFLDTPVPEKWKQSGLFENLLNHLKFGSISRLLVLFYFEINSEDESYVLEANFLYEADRQIKPPREALGKYLDSKVSLAQYDDSYEMPELAVKVKIPLDRIKMVNSFF